jgi:hypothetical protein
VLRVSSDPLDGADFEVIQDAVDASFESGSRVEIFPGLGPYYESVRLDRHQVYSILGLDGGPLAPVIVDGGSGPAFQAVNKIGSAPMRFSWLTLRGYQGVRASVDLHLEQMVFEMIGAEAVKLDSGKHLLTRSRIENEIGVGVDVDDGASVTVDRTTIREMTDAGVVARGTATLENVLIGDGGGADGVRMGPAGNLEASYCTIAGNTGVGIDASQGGSVELSYSIVYDNDADDLVAMACSAVSWSDVGVPDCSAVNDNVAGDPQLDADYRLGAGSVCLDHGPDPALYTGTPPTDADGGPRLRDHDGDGEARNDCGAYEEENTSPDVGEVLNLRWDLSFRLVWDPVAGAALYHTYRGDVASLGFAYYGSCSDGLDGDLTDTQLDDFDEPQEGEAFFYLATAESGTGEEGTLGLGTSAERSNYSSCP